MRKRVFMSSDADHFLCNSRIEVTRFTPANIAYCFHVVVLALCSSSSITANNIFCFLFVCIVLFEAASRDKGEVSHG